MWLHAPDADADADGWRRVGDPRNGQQRIVGRLLPPQQRRNDLHEIEFRLRELPP
jgi:hypothetical protein